ncbi:MAG TPA: selenoneine synthase SenA [Ramlibacter sp.]|nr:selenoneine synthase SenA [Ramlibacter sp.]
MNETYTGYSAAQGVPLWAPAQALRTAGPATVRAGLLAVRERTLAVAAAYADALGPAMAVPQDDGLNPPLWELGHLAWFQEWWIARNDERELGVRCEPTRARPPASLPGADAWYDSGAVAHADRWRLPLPDYPRTLAWLATTLESTLALLDALPADASDDTLYFFRLVCLHEAMHGEAFCYMAKALRFAIAAPADMPTPRTAPCGPLQIPAQRWQLGSAGPGFVFDNEAPAHVVKLDAFEIDSQAVSWSRFADFADDGGYTNASWWSPEGWAWRKAARPAEPAFARSEAPAVHLSFHEAQAWCRWAGRRLPTEAQWECAAMTAPGFAWGRVWEWTASSFVPYAGFEPHPYRDYSQPWFGTRPVLRGACEATSPLLAHPRYRNYFPAHRTDIFAGFRSCA